MPCSASTSATVRIESSILINFKFSLRVSALVHFILISYHTSAAETKFRELCENPYIQ